MGMDLTRQNLAWTLVLFIAMFLLFWSRVVFYSIEIIEPVTGGMPLGLLLDHFADTYPIAGGVLTAFCVLMGGFVLTRIVSRNMIVIERIYMPLLIFLMVGCGSFFDPVQPAVYVMSLLLVLGSNLMVESFRRVRLYGLVFNGAFLFGCMPLIYSPGVISLLLLFSALIVFRKNPREWVVAFAGYLLPFALCSYVYWGMGYDFLYVGQHLVQGVKEYITVSGNIFFAEFNPQLYAFWGILFLITVLSLLAYAVYSRTMRTRPYKTCLFFGWMLLVLIVLFIALGRSVRIFPLMAVPLSIFIPLFFNRRADWLSNLAFLLLIGSVVVGNLIPFLIF